jgi:deazaflavin-dependent oxidoreductase (nitroreductase family)
MNLQHTLTTVGAKVMNAGHRAILAVSGGRWLDRPFGMQAVELHVTGRKSGQRRSCMLTAPILEDDRVVIIASKGGYDHHPEWYLNLEANPDVELTIKGDTKPMRARTASPEEKKELWPRVVNAYKGYEGYQKRTTRDIPVVILEPR